MFILIFIPSSCFDQRTISYALMQRLIEILLLSSFAVIAIIFLWADIREKSISAFFRDIPIALVK
ncbi:hypothetical protein Q7M63_02365 [Candidatus Liberibacter asiaticus]|nr:hypothetical protein [Candidatus Liberibacter asiaticus]AGH16834.1 hypothetical protein WSI_02320 [Candidatus Liberibacter asiaticus str. gxpsy]KRF69072.1 hypothetical protein AQ620_01185 [Candidatus Liberibacter asiaticus]MBA2917362.1 hypothetical protein [Candidatus Liberibacter asiaticus]MCU7487871.1 hypothetical protein [Candidatus Liberibacter asiaticus]QGA30509.1 hypothetical protein CD16_05635 [Candidatus Liberibacter asiaticus]